MSNEQARKLLGGYATNSLTDAERKALYEAALEDQELFDALQHEEALKELLADPVSRNEIQRALAQPAAARPARAAWWSQGWLWGGVAGALAAAVLLVAVIRSNQPRSYQTARVVPKAPAPIVAEPKIEVPVPKKPVPSARANKATQRLQPAVPAAQAAAAAPPPPPRIPLPPAAAVKDSVGAATLSSGARFATNFKAQVLQYSWVKANPPAENSIVTGSLAAPQPGEAVRLNVFSAIAGLLWLDQLDPSGDWKRIYPASGEGLLVPANVTRAIPDSPIMVTDTEQKFRLTLVPPEEKTSAQPLMVEITLAPAKKP